jgi:hypothetical protein
MFYMGAAADMSGKSVDRGKEISMLGKVADNSLLDKDRGIGNCRRKDRLAKDKAADSLWDTAWACKSA